jgi:hypothetical protein
MISEVSINMESKSFRENIREKGRMGNSTHVAINKVRKRAKYKQASMVLCKPGLHSTMNGPVPTHDPSSCGFWD